MINYLLLGIWIACSVSLTFSMWDHKERRWTIKKEKGNKKPTLVSENGIVPGIFSEEPDSR